MLARAERKEAVPCRRGRTGGGLREEKGGRERQEKDHCVVAKGSIRIAFEGRD